ncbi:hypothetical protein GHT06_018338 [Daphnia sinensis]|uniref:Uncharacterized protein n=1 Tax=Daphnia sinensis TaxID=1820382 RepID=A0AAD5KME6_9CRUS|nr:hypothetical protein GHT06_018338 [Daphnia sinensis]
MFRDEFSAATLFLSAYSKGTATLVSCHHAPGRAVVRRSENTRCGHGTHTKFCGALLGWERDSRHLISRCWTRMKALDQSPSLKKAVVPSPR